MIRPRPKKTNSTPPAVKGKMATLQGERVDRLWRGSAQ